MSEPDEPPLCAWCNKPVPVFGDLCPTCEASMREADEGRGEYF